MSKRALCVVCWYSFCALPQRHWAVGSGTPSAHCRAALGQWAVVFLLYTASPPWGSG